jgi:ubiquinone/menaquinone biosynthesis C-methylase UbiE
MLKSILDFNEKTILDIGCGTGRLSFRLAEISRYVMGIDNDAEEIAIAKQMNDHDNVCFEVADADDLPVFDMAFDVVVFSWSLNYIVDTKKALSEAIKYLKQDGILLILYTAKGDYENLMQAVTEVESIDENFYDSATLYLQELGFTLSHDVINTVFHFASIKDALEKNSFFLEMVNCSEDKKEIFLKLLQHQATADGSVEINDTVKLLIARR